MTLGWTRRRWVQALIDATGITAAFLFAVLLRYDFSFAKTFVLETVFLALCSGALVVVVGGLSVSTRGISPLRRRSVSRSP